MMQPAEPEPEPESVDASGLGVPPELMDFVHRAHAAQEAVNALGAGKPAATVELDSPLNVSRETSEREFLDTHDSWTLDLRSKPAHLTLADYLSILESAGLGYEIRVWRNR
jgi:hypothetical protein